MTLLWVSMVCGLSSKALFHGGKMEEIMIIQPLSVEHMSLFRQIPKNPGSNPSALCFVTSTAVARIEYLSMPRNVSARSGQMPLLNVLFLKCPLEDEVVPNRDMTLKTGRSLVVYDRVGYLTLVPRHPFIVLSSSGDG